MSDLGLCECGQPLADGGIVGVYCIAGWKCPEYKRISNSIFINWNLRPLGVSRMADNDRAVLVCFNRAPTDNELREIHEKLKK